MTDDLEKMAIALDASGDYRVLRRLRRRGIVNAPTADDRVMNGIALDVETTGLNPKTDEIIELAMAPFTFAADGRIFEVSGGFQSLQQPSRPIPPEIVELTGIDDGMVAGQSIDAAAVDAIVAPASLIIAHHAAFDRPFVERLFPVFAKKCWACSMSEIDWKARGSESAKLAWLLSEFGLFYNRHQALSDCFALIGLLSQPLNDGPALAQLLAAARQPTWRIWAPETPFEAKDTLKARGYRWSPGEGHFPKSWYIDVRTEDARNTEIGFLIGEIYRRERPLPIDKLTAYDRFSEATNP